MTEHIVSATALFCESIRKEIGGTYSLIGILSDNIQVDFPATFAALSIYARVSIPSATPPQSMAIALYVDDEEISRENASAEHLLKLAEDAASKRNPITSIIVNISLTGLGVEAPCRMRVIAYIDGREIEAGGLRLIAAPKSN